MKNRWMGVLAVAIVRAAYGGVEYSVSHLPGLSSSTYDSAEDISPAGVVGYSIEEQPFTFHPIFWQGSQPSFLSLPSGYQGSAVGVNDQGTVVGAVRPSGTFDTQPALWQNNQLQILPTQGMSGGIAYAINNQGNAVGMISNSSVPEFKAALWHNGQVETLGNFTGAQSAALAINDSGQIVISASYSDHDETWLWTNGVLSQIPSMGSPYITGTSINSHGDVVGTISNADNSQTGFLYTGGTTVALPTLAGNVLTQALSINDAGQIVGYNTDSTDTFQALLWQNGQVFNLNDLIAPDSRWILQQARSIGEDGTIVGYGLYNGQQQAFELTPSVSPSGTTPTPEPATVATLVLAAPLLLRRRRRSV